MISVILYENNFNCSGLPHLAVSNSTPPPSTSPLSIKVKSEPASPPRDHHPHNSIITGGGGGGGGGSGGGGGLGSNNSNQTTTITMGNSLLNQNSLLQHPQHLLLNSRPSSTGHLTPNSGKCWSWKY